MNLTTGANMTGHTLRPRTFELRPVWYTAPNAAESEPRERYYVAVASRGRSPDKWGVYERESDETLTFVTEEDTEALGEKRLALCRKEALNARIGCNVQGRIDAFLREAYAGEDESARRELIKLADFFR
jgi:hypothetical protein